MRIIFKQDAKIWSHLQPLIGSKTLIFLKIVCPTLFFFQGPDGWKGHPLGPPIVVHCSAGIGRTGTFATLDISIRKFLDERRVDIRSTVEQIRAQRAYSIQVRPLYSFVFIMCTSKLTFDKLSDPGLILCLCKQWKRTKNIQLTSGHGLLS